MTQRLRPKLWIGALALLAIVWTNPAQAERSNRLNPGPIDRILPGIERINEAVIPYGYRPFPQWSMPSETRPLLPAEQSSPNPYGYGDYPAAMSIMRGARLAEGEETALWVRASWPPMIRVELTFP